MHASNSNIQDILLSIICLFRAAGKWKSRLGKRSVGLLRCPRPSIGTQSGPLGDFIPNERKCPSCFDWLAPFDCLDTWYVYDWYIWTSRSVSVLKSPCHTKRWCHSAQNLASTRISHSVLVASKTLEILRAKLLQHAHSAHSSCWIFLLICIYFYYVQHIIANKEAFLDFVLEFHSRY